MTADSKAIVSFDDVLGELERGNRVLLVVRHAERPKIGHEDKSFGQTLALTDAGVRMSEEFGERLRRFGGSVEFRASPLLRTVMTAEAIARGMGRAGAAVERDAAIGNSSAFVASELEMWEHFRDGRFFPKMADYFHTGSARGFNGLARAADEFERDLLERFRAELALFVTHDVYIAAYLYARGVQDDFTVENWPRFLDAAAIVAKPGGERSVALFRAGLSDKICGVPNDN